MHDIKETVDFGISPKIIKTNPLANEELIDWCKKWGSFTPEVLFKSIQINCSGDNDVCVINSETYVIDKK